MEKNRNIWHPPRSLLGLILVGMIFSPFLAAEETFDVSLVNALSGFDYKAVNSTSFFFTGTGEMDVDSIVKSIGKGKADVLITGKNGVEGESLSPDLSIYISVDRNTEQKSCLVKIEACVNGVSTRALATGGTPYRSYIPVWGRILVFTDSKEIEPAISSHLKTLVNKMTEGKEKKPKFFVVH